MSDDILLAGQPIKITQVINLSQPADVPEHRVEDGFSVADTIVLKPAEFELQLEVDKDQLNELKQFYEQKQPVELVCKFGIFENVVIKELSATQGGSTNYFRATLRVRQILKAKAKTTTVSLPELQVTPDESEASGGDTAIPPQQQNVPSAPEKQENKSWLDSIFDWFGSLFGG